MLRNNILSKITPKQVTEPKELLELYGGFWERRVFGREGVRRLRRFVKSFGEDAPPAAESPIGAEQTPSDSQVEANCASLGSLLAAYKQQISECELNKGQEYRTKISMAVLYRTFCRLYRSRWTEEMSEYLKGRGLDVCLANRQSRRAALVNYLLWAHYGLCPSANTVTTGAARQRVESALQQGAAYACSEDIFGPAIHILTPSSGLNE